MKPEERADSICKWTNQGLRDLVVMAIKEAMRDQRHACAEAINELENFLGSSASTIVNRHAAHQAVINAKVK